MTESFLSSSGSLANFSALFQAGNDHQHKMPLGMRTKSSLG